LGRIIIVVLLPFRDITIVYLWAAPINRKERLFVVHIVVDYTFLNLGPCSSLGWRKCVLP
jgi:hypothetical protein